MNKYYSCSCIKYWLILILPSQKGEFCSCHLEEVAVSVKQCTEVLLHKKLKQSFKSLSRKELAHLLLIYSSHN